MYIALFVMLAGMLGGRLLGRRVSQAILGRCIFMAILLLLFLLGIQIGANDSLFAALPSLGLQGALLMLSCVAGSIIVIKLIVNGLGKLGIVLTGKKNAR